MPWLEPWHLKLRRRVRKPYNKLFHRNYFIAKYMGAQFLLAPSGIGSLEISAGISEKPEILHFMSRCRDLRPDQFIDIGSNIGMYACILLENGCVPFATLFEPDRKNQSHLGANLLINGLLQSADIRPVALGDINGSLCLLPGETDGGFSRIVSEPKNRAYEVAVRLLDDELDASGKALAIKIDVEGFEQRVLNGMQRTLRQNRCLVQIEAFEPSGVFSFMDAAGYRLTKDFLPNYVFEN